MKRLIPAGIILILLITVCVFSHIYIERICDQSLKDVEDYYSGKISASALQNSWDKRKDKMSIFANHEFLDKISIYIGELSLSKINSNSSEFNIAYKNIETVLSLIKAEQKFTLYSFC